MSHRGVTLPKRQRGVALLVALLVVALAVILIAGLLDRGELALARTRNVLRSEQAEAYARGLEIYAAQVLVATAGSNNGVDTNASPWALPLPPQPVPGGMISATMRDRNGCFNLNNLSSASGGNPGLWLPVFRNLLAALQIDPNAIAAPVVAWLDVAGAEGSSDNAYLALPVPYRPRHGLFVHVSELRLVQGVDADIYARLAPYVCALPPGTRINIDTASVPVLQSLGAGVSQAIAQELWQNGAAQWTTAAFENQLKQLGVPIDVHLDSEITDQSTYFMARSEILLDAVPFTFHSLIERRIGGAGNGIHVLERSRGADDALVAPAPIAARHDHATTLDQ